MLVADFEIRAYERFILRKYNIQSEVAARLWDAARAAASPQQPTSSTKQACGHRGASPQSVAPL
jgi:hypothetical protein